MPSRDPYLIGKLGSYDVATLAKVDSHLRALRLRLTTRIEPRQRIQLWADINALLDRRSAMTADDAATRPSPVRN
jgi:hypothetical protein